MNTAVASRAATRVGGWSLIAAAVGFIAVFSYLAARFNYPEVLDGAAADVLPRLLELGSTGRAVWSLYALLPLLLIPAGIGAHSAWRHVTPNLTRAALVLAALTALAMLLGLARWSTIHWEMAQAYASASQAAREALYTIFTGLNVFLGNFIGEFLGELTLNAFFLTTGISLWRGGRRIAGGAGMLVALLGLIAGFRNISPAVGPVAEMNNYILPLWLVVLGVVMLRSRPLAA